MMVRNGTGRYLFLRAKFTCCSNSNLSEFQFGKAVDFFRGILTFENLLMNLKTKKQPDVDV